MGNCETFDSDIDFVGTRIIGKLVLDYEDPNIFKTLDRYIEENYVKYFELDNIPYDTIRPFYEGKNSKDMELR